MKTKLITALVATFILSSSALADDPIDPIVTEGGTVNFIGKITNGSCAVETNAQNLEVQLGEYRASKFTAIDQKSTMVPFKIKLVDCDTTVTKSASISFNGQTDATNKELLAVNSGGSNAVSATGIGIQILDGESSPVTPDGSVYSGAYNLIDGNNTLDFSAGYVSTAAAVTAGQANASATFSIKYE